MDSFPSLKVIVFTLVAICIYVSVDFYFKGEKVFFQLNYDWNNKELVKSYNVKNIDTVSHNYIRLSLIDSSVAGPELNSDYTLSVDEDKFFRYASLDQKNTEITFRGVYWINSVPSEEFIADDLKIWQLPMIQNGDHTVCMIGDSQLAWRDGRYTRKELVKNVKNLRFVGDHRDVIGYPYQASLLNNSKKIVESLDEVPTAKTYVLFIGAHEKTETDTEENLKKIINFFLQKPSSIILTIPPEYNDRSKNLIRNVIKNTYLKYQQNKNVSVIDLGEKITNRKDYLLSDGIHLSPLGHQVLNSSLIDAFKDLE